MTLQQPLRLTHVVTCLLLRTDQDKDRLLLVERSPRVGSYHGRWAGISGFLEPNVTADEQAYTEILEETGLQRDQIRLLKRGTIVEHIDEELRRHFYVHPFLFEVLTPDAIQIDWEATRMCWIEPSELPKYETVPKLQEVYDSALQGAG